MYCWRFQWCLILNHHPCVYVCVCTYSHPGVDRIWTSRTTSLASDYLWKFHILSTPRSYSIFYILYSIFHNIVYIYIYIYLHPLKSIPTLISILSRLDVNPAWDTHDPFFYWGYCIWYFNGLEYCRMASGATKWGSPPKRNLVDLVADTSVRRTVNGLVSLGKCSPETPIFFMGKHRWFPVQFFPWTNPWRLFSFRKSTSFDGPHDRRSHAGSPSAAALGLAVVGPAINGIPGGGSINWGIPTNGSFTMENVMEIWMILGVAQA